MSFQHTRRKFLIAGATGATSTLLGVPRIASAQQTAVQGSGSVIVYDGGGSMGIAQRKAYSEPFEKETGIRVIHQPGVSAGIQLATIKAGTPKYDVANISGGAIETFIQGSFVLPIDYSHWSTADRNGFDVVPTNKYHVPAMLYSMLLAYDSKRFATHAPVHWSDIWNASAFPGRATLASGVNAADGCTFEIALLADGVPPDKLYPIDWARAFRSLDRLKPNLAKWWATGAESIQLQVDGDAAIGSAWNGRIDAANDAGATIGKSWEQGILQWSTWAIPKGAKNIDNAQQYIAFISRPETQAHFSELITYGPTNSRAFTHISADLAPKLPTAPALKGKQILQNYGFWNSADSTGVTGLNKSVSEWERWISKA